MYTKTKLNLIFNRNCSWTRHCEIDVFGNWPNFFLNWPNFLDVLAGNFLGPGNTGFRPVPLSTVATCLATGFMDLPITVLAPIVDKENDSNEAPYGGIWFVPGFPSVRIISRCYRWSGGFLDFLKVLYSTLLHLPPLRFHCVGGCWDRT